MKYNTTELKPFEALERGIVHRDMLAHVNRWSFVMNRVEPNMKVLDFGCGSGGLAEILYRNRVRPARFLGLELRPGIVKKLEAQFPWAEFKVQDLTTDFDHGTDWDLICSFEVIEHVHKANGRAFLSNLAKHCSPNTTVLLSTPNYDPQVGAAANHTYDGMVHEYEYQELNELLQEKFTILAEYGTFASKKDYYHLLTEEQQKLWTKLHEFYDSNVMAVLFAPLFPREARNCLRVMRLK